MELVESCTRTSGNKKVEDTAALVIKPIAKVSKLSSHDLRWPFCGPCACSFILQCAECLHYSIGQPKL